VKLKVQGKKNHVERQSILDNRYYTGLAGNPDLVAWLDLGHSSTAPRRKKPTEIKGDSYP